MRSATVFALLALVFTASTLTADGKRRAVQHPTVVFYADVDHDGFGDILKPVPNGGADGVANNAMDCDDADPTTFPRFGLVLNCDADEYADDPTPVTKCLGDSEIVRYPCAGGTCARKVFVDRTGNFPVYYSSLEDVVRDAEGRPVQDASPGCATQ